jgi:hypothetical protein
MKYQPKIGSDFPVTKEIISAKTNQIIEVTRSTIALCIVVVGALALISTAGFCAYKGEFQYLQTVWAILAAPLGWIIGHYFRGNGPNDKVNDEGST